MIREVINGYAMTIKLRNRAQLEHLNRTLPYETQVRVAVTLTKLDEQLADPIVKARFEAVGPISLS